MCITYPALSYEFATSFSIFSIFALSGKKGKSLWKLYAFLRCQHQHQSFIIFIITAFYEILIKFRCFFNSFKIFYRQILWHSLTIQMIYISISKVWRFIIFIIIFMHLLLVFYISINSVTYSSSDTFSTIKSISI